MNECFGTQLPREPRGGYSRSCRTREGMEGECPCQKVLEIKVHGSRRAGMARQARRGREAQATAAGKERDRETRVEWPRRVLGELGHRADGCHRGPSRTF